MESVERKKKKMADTLYQSVRRPLDTVTTNAKPGSASQILLTVVMIFQRDYHNNSQEYIHPKLIPIPRRVHRVQFFRIDGRVATKVMRTDSRV